MHSSWEFFPNSKQYSLKVRRKGARITSIEAGPHFSAADFVALKGEVQRILIESPGVGMWRNILFSSVPVKGHFRHASGTFQICPIPAEAPQLGSLGGDHPFILEFQLRESQDKTITIFRRAKKALEWTLILNALLRPLISSIGPNLKQFWAYCPDEQQPNLEEKWQTKWVQEGYSIKNFSSRISELSNLQGISIFSIPHQEYYGRKNPDGFVLPDTFSSMLDSIEKLSDSERARFIRAIQWKYTADRVWEHSQSLTFVALVASFESLMPQDDPQEHCPTCGKNISQGPTQKFQDFVERYGPQSPVCRKKRRLYATRSKIMHGAGLISPDEKPFTFRSHDELIDQDELDDISRQVLINWLIEKYWGTAARDPNL